MLQPVSVIIFLFLYPSSCSRSGDELAEDLALGPYATINGSVSPQTGSQADLAGWVIALIDKDSGISRMASIDSSGLFHFDHAYLRLTYTIALFSPSLILRGILAHPAEHSLSIWQYFRVAGSDKPLPKLIYKGLTLTWQDTQGIYLSPETVQDVAGDGIPPGVREELLRNQNSLSLNTDSDNDGIPNQIDSDTDGDGMPNLLDQNDDNDETEEGDSLPDVLDADANGNGIMDTEEENSDVYFPRAVSWALAKFEMIPNEDGSSFYRYIVLVLKLRDNIKPDSVRVWPGLRFSLFESASVTQKDGSTVPWDGLLADDGQSDDGAPDDGVYGKRIKLKSGNIPGANQIIPFELVYGSNQPWSQVLLFAFPGLQPLSVLPSYDSTTRTVTFHEDASNPPFHISTGFVWIIVVYEERSDGTKTAVYTSQPISGSESHFTLPDNIIAAGHNYQYKVIAQSLDKVPGHAIYRIESSLKEIPSL
ncbi:MAG: thrombospondin type 3 repeat-containing protein [Deltaproteobacteria bacterium]|nr:thrombospondin type 3 repeat-containing protein [Deltaproteobacteria bacterium]